MSLVLALLLHTVAAFESRTIPLASEDSAVYLGPVETGAARNIVVQDGSKITVHALWGSSEPRQAILPEGVTAFDIADMDGDHQAEVIAVAGTQVVRIPLSTVPAAPTTLFTADSVFSGDAGDPYLYPLALRVSDRTSIGLPKDNQVDLYSTTGEKTDQLALVSDEKSDPHENFNTFAFEGQGSLNWSIWQREEFIPAFPPNTFPYVGASGGTGNGIIMATRPYDSKVPSDWPWFPIRKVGDEILKAHFSLFRDAAGQLRQQTSINIRSLGAQSPEDGNSGEEQVYRYPGVLISSWEAPDFNGDGYNDILLGRMPRPGGSLSALVRTLTNAALPFEVAVHLYLPDKHRFDPRPTSLVGFRVNLMSFLEGGVPTERIVMRDFNGDGRTDLAVVSNEKQLVAWLYGDKGFSTEPDYTFNSPDPMWRVVLVGVLKHTVGKPNWSFGVRTEQNNLIVFFYSGDS